MIPPRPPDTYSPRDQALLREEIRRADADNFKRGRDLEIAGGRVILTSPNGTRYALTVSNAGALGTVAV
jgi:hypothetical protein